MFAALPDDSLVVMDGLAFGPLVEAVEEQMSRLQFVAVVHLPLSADPSLPPNEGASLRGGELRALQHASRIVVTGSESYSILRGCGTPSDRLRIVEPGTDRGSLARGSCGPSVHVVCVATLNAIKGHDLLIRSLARLRDLNWRLSCAGSITHDAATVASVRHLIGDVEIEERVTLLGELAAPELERLLDSADVFALATRFETFGMAVAEAVARGLPVVSTRTGAIPRIVGNEAGLLVPPDTEDALTAALRCVIGDPAVRASLRAGALRARDRLEPWPAAVRKFATVLTELVNRE